MPKTLESEHDIRLIIADAISNGHVTLFFSLPMQRTAAAAAADIELRRRRFYYIAHDVGYRHLPGVMIQFERRPLPSASAPVSLASRKRDRDEEEKAVSHGRVRILHWQVWDLARNTCKATYDRADDKTPPISWVSDARFEKLEMKAAETRRLVSVEIFRVLGERLAHWEPYDAKRYGKVPVFIEPQMDQFRSQGASVQHEIAKAIITAVATIDKMRGLGAPKRTIELRAKKHGLARANKGRKRAKKGAEKEEEKKEVAPDLILLDQEEKGEEAAAVVVGGEKIMPPLPTADDSKKKRAPRKEEENPVVVDQELHAKDYNDRKRLSVILCKRRLEQDGDLAALHFIEQIERDLASDGKREVVPYDLADAFNIALAVAEEEARIAEHVAGMR